MSMQNFLKQFTLHDSWLKALTIDSQGKVVLEVGFDLAWNPSVPSGHDTLRIRFDHTYRVRWMQGGWEQSTLAGAESTIVASGDRVALLDDIDFDVRAYQGVGPQYFTHPSFDESLTRTRFQLVNWASTEVLHTEGASLLRMRAATKSTLRPFGTSRQVKRCLPKSNGKAKISSNSPGTQVHSVIVGST